VGMQMYSNKSEQAMDSRNAIEDVSVATKS